MITELQIVAKSRASQGPVALLSVIPYRELPITERRLKCVVKCRISKTRVKKETEGGPPRQRKREIRESVLSPILADEKVNT